MKTEGERFFFTEAERALVLEAVDEHYASFIDTCRTPEHANAMLDAIEAVVNEGIELCTD